MISDRFKPLEILETRPTDRVSFCAKISVADRLALRRFARTERSAALPLLIIGLLSREAMQRWRKQILALGQGIKATFGVLLIVIGILKGRWHDQIVALCPAARSRSRRDCTAVAALCRLGLCRKLRPPDRGIACEGPLGASRVEIRGQ